MLDLNIKPYFDDYNEDKGFYRVLYRPSFGLQARELNQMQTIMQEQIARFGRHMFKNGAMVKPGGINFDPNMKYVKLEKYSSSKSITPIDVSLFLGEKIIGTYSGMEAEVLNAIPETENGDIVDPPTLYIKITKNGSVMKEQDIYDENGNATNEKEIYEELFYDFVDGEDIVAESNPSIRATVQIATFRYSDFDQNLIEKDGFKIKVKNNQQIDTCLASGLGCSATLNEGIYFINGFFVKAQKQSIIIDKYDNHPTCRIGLRLYDTIVTPEEDLSLTDNAQGSYNYAAPGAHRYKLDLRLEWSPFISDPETNTDRITTEEGDHFIMLMTVEEGEVMYQVESTEYAELERTLARRTYDESGDYTVKPFMLTTYEHYKDPNDPSYALGKYFYDDPRHPGDKNKIAIQMSAGKAYIKGYEVKKIAPTWLEADKALDYEMVNNEAITAVAGSYVYVTGVYQLPDVANFQRVELFTVDLEGIGDQGQKSKVGTANIRGIELVEKDVNPYDFLYRIYLFNVQCDAPFSEIKSIVGVGTGKQSAFTCSLLFDEQKYPYYAPYKQALVNPYKSSCIFPLPERYVRSVSVGGRQSGTPDTSFYQQKMFDSNKVIPNGNTFSIAVEEGFSFDLTANKWLAFTTSAGTPGDAYLDIIDITLSSDNKTVNVEVNKDVTGKSIRVLCPYSVNVAGVKTKTLQQYNNGASPAYLGEVINEPKKMVDKYGKIYLSKPDGVSLIAVYTYKDNTAGVLDGDGNLLDNWNPDDLNLENPNVKNITEQFSFNGGQTDAYYGDAYLTFDAGTDTLNYPIRVLYTYFEHSGNGYYFSVDSYEGIGATGEDAQAPEKLERRYIPNYQMDSGEIVSLADCIDFRPVISELRGNSGNTIYPNSPIRVDYDYYLARIDTVYIDCDGKFGVVRGIPAKYPVPPETPENAMRLWKLHYAPATTTLSDIQKEYEENKRYTMRDIGKLEKRIDNLEYYVALSLLEIQTLQMQICDTDGNSRFKNGFLVDPFNSHEFGERGNADYKCSIDIQKQELRPTFATNNIQLQYRPPKNEVAPSKATSSYEGSEHVQKTSTLVTLPYDHVPLIEQPLISTMLNVNPYAVRMFGGVITLNPESDSWFETEKVGTKIVDYSPYYDAVNTMANGLWDGEHWGDWYQTGQTSNTVTTYDIQTTSDTTKINSKTSTSSNTVLTGSSSKTKTTNTSSTEKLTPAQLKADLAAGKITQAQYNALPHTGWSSNAGVRKTNTTNSTTTTKNNYQTTTTTTTTDTYMVTELTATTEINTTTTITDWQRDGWKGSHNDVVTETDFGDRTTGISDIQYMRERMILCKASMMKPKTKVYPFFDDVDVKQYCTPCPLVDCEYIKNVNGELGPYFFTTDTIEECITTNPDISAYKNMTFDECIIYEMSKPVNQRYDMAMVVHNSYHMKNKIDENGKVIKDSNGKPVKEFAYSQITFANWLGWDTSLINASHRFKKGATLRGTKTGAYCVLADDPPVYSGNGGEDIVTSKAGTVAMMFGLPNNETHKFKTGERILVLTDQINNSQPSQTKAEGKYISRGYTLQQEGTTVKTKSIQLSQTPISETKQTTDVKVDKNTSYSMNTYTYDEVTVDVQTNNFSTTSTSSSSNSTFNYYDPLAQSFVVDLEGGCFITKISVCFATKDEELPVSCSILEMDNGFPTRNTLPYSTKILYPHEITCVEDPSKDPFVWTTFEMEAPVYLSPDAEYAIFLITDSFDYHIWCATIGTKDLRTGQYISSQPYDGVIFKSQNASTWTEDQETDMCFKIERAKFDISSPGIFLADNEPIKSSVHYFNNIETAKGCSWIRIHHPNHGLWAGANVSIDGIATKDSAGADISYNGIKGSAINKSHQIKSVELDSFMIYLGENADKANDSGMIAEASPNYAANIPFDVFNPNIANLVFDSTNIDWSYDYTYCDSVGQESGEGRPVQNGQPVCGGQRSQFLSCLMTQDNFLPYHGSIRGEANHGTDQNKQWSLRICGTMTSDVDNLSPVIDLTTCSTILVVNRVDYPRLSEIYPTMKFKINDDKVTITTVDDHFMADGSMVYFDASEAAGDMVTEEEYDELTGNIIKSTVKENPYPTLFPVKDSTGEVGNGTASSGQAFGRKNANNMYGYDLEGWYPVTVTGPKTFTITMPNVASSGDTFDLKKQNGNTPDPVLSKYNIEGVKFYYSPTHYKYVPENKPRGASTASRYFTKKITIENPSTAVKLMFTCACQPEADFEIWVKKQNQYSGELFEDIEWFRVNDVKFQRQISTNITDFKDYECTLEFGSEDGNDDLNEFNSISVKIVMKSIDQTIVPLFKNLRVICLGT